MKRAISRKNLWDSLPRAAKTGLGSLLGLAPPRYLLGGRFRRALRVVQEAQWWPADRAREYQLRELQRICSLAFEKAPFYRQSFEAAGFQPGDLKSIEDMAALPTINRSTLRDHLDAMCAASVNGSGVDYISTGGTSGAPLQFYIGADRSALEYAYLTTTWERCGYRLGMPMAVVRGRIVAEDRDGLRHEYDPILRHHYYSNFHMTDDNMRRYLDHVRGIGPCFLHAYPSSAFALARLVRDRGLARPGNIRGIMAESENVYPDQRAFIEEVLGARMFSSYGHSEKAVLAAECEHSTAYHVWPTYGYMELLDEQGQPVTTPGKRGEIVGTSFINTVVPFIRYRTGDYATYAGDRCEACGRQHTLIQDVEGRWPAGAFVTSDGSLISMTAVNVHDDTFANARQFQFYQDTPGRTVLRVVATDRFGEEDLARIRRTLARKFDGRLQFDIQIVDSIPLSPRGKAIYVDQRLATAEARSP